VLAGPPANADEQTLETLVHAFLDDPLFAFIFPRAERRERDAVWTPRASMHVSIGAAWRAAMLALPLQLGLPAMRRLDMYELELDRVTRDAAGGDFAYLWMLAAHPRAQGRGLGRAAVEHALGQMRAAGFAQCLLRTQQPRNVSFYRHLGFREVLRHTPAWVDLETIVFARDL
jgi:ribosomal protein S18 acetylase RimI-like enzyme